MITLWRQLINPVNQGSQIRDSGASCGLMYRYIYLSTSTSVFWLSSFSLTGNLGGGDAKNLVLGTGFMESTSVTFSLLYWYWFMGVQHHEQRTCIFSVLLVFVWQA